MRPISPTNSSPTLDVRDTAFTGENSRQSHELPRFPVLDGLRGLAAVAIVLFHYMIGPAQSLHWLARATDLCGDGPLSLDTFFILSGFLIGGILLHIKNQPNYYKMFYQRRCLRIMPLYYLWIGLFCVLCLAGYMAPPVGIRRSAYLGSYIFFLQSFFPAIVTSNYMVVPTWTLVVEEHFYLLIPVCVRRMTSRGLFKVLLAIVVLAPVFRGVVFKCIGHEDQWADMAVSYWPPCRADALALGVLLAVVWHSDRLRDWLRQNVRLAQWAMLAGSGVTIFLDYMSSFHPTFLLIDEMLGRTALEFSCLGLVVYLISHPEKPFARFLCSRTMRRLGRISYCIYIIHFGVLWMLMRFVFHARIGEYLWLDLAIAPVGLVLSIAVAELSWRYLERPLLQRTKGTRKPVLVTTISSSQTQTA